MMFLKIKKIIDHEDKNYHRDQRIRGHIICTRVLDRHKNVERIDWLSIGTGITIFIAFSLTN
jgi:hypothetical protein